MNFTNILDWKKEDFQKYKNQLITITFKKEIKLDYINKKGRKFTGKCLTISLSATENKPGERLPTTIYFLDQEFINTERDKIEYATEILIDFNIKSIKIN